MPGPLVTEGSQIASATVDPFAFATSFGRSLGITSEQALNEGPFRSIMQSQRISAMGGQTGGITGAGGDVFRTAISRSGRGGILAPADPAAALAREEAAIEAELADYREQGLWISYDEAAQAASDEGFTPEDLGVTRYGMNAAVFQLILKANRDERVATSALANAPGGIIASPVRFGVGMAASLTDPINLGTSFIPIFGQSRYVAPLIKEATAVGRAIGAARGVLNRGIFAVEEAATFGARTAQRAAIGATEAFVGSAVIEPFILESQQLQALDYTMADSMSNILLGTLAGGGLHMGLGAISDAVARIRAPEMTTPQGLASEALAGYDPETRHAALQATIGQTEGGYNVDASMILAMDTGFRERVLPRRDTVPPGMVHVVDDAGNVTVRRWKEGSRAHIIAEDIEGPRSSPKALEAFDKLPPEVRRRLELRAVIDTLEADKADAYGIKTTAGSRDIVNAIAELGQIQSREGLGKKARADYKNAPGKGLATRLYSEASALAPARMAKMLQERFGLGNGTVGRMWELVNHALTERTRLASELDQAKFELAFLGKEMPATGAGIMSKTLADAVGLPAPRMALADVEAARQRLASGGDSAHVEMAQAMRDVTQRRGYDADAIRLADAVLAEPDRIDAARIEQEIADLEQGLDYFAIDQEMIRDAVSEAADLGRIAERDARAIGQAMLCGMNRG